MKRSAGQQKRKQSRRKLSKQQGKTVLQAKYGETMKPAKIVVRNLYDADFKQTFSHNAFVRHQEIHRPT